jgi:peptidoglycan/xylan/chitin deacetylase (PgdA/CDA1 family)
MARRHVAVPAVLAAAAALAVPHSWITLTRHDQRQSVGSAHLAPALAVDEAGLGPLSGGQNGLRIFLALAAFAAVGAILLSESRAKRGRMPKLRLWRAEAARAESKAQDGWDAGRASGAAKSRTAPANPTAAESEPDRVGLHFSPILSARSPASDTLLDPKVLEQLPEDCWVQPRGGAYYWATQQAHRLQVALARRAGTTEAWQGGVRILGYHRVAEARDQLAVPPKIFRAQMEMMLAMGAEVLSLDDAHRVLQEGAAGRYVCVTFDDGYHDILEHAVPVLRELGIPATIFIPTAMVDGTVRLYWYVEQPWLLSWSELLELDSNDLISIGAHSRTHPALPRLSGESAWAEIAGCKRDLEDRLGHHVTSFAYPAGMYGEREASMVRDAGYRVAVTTEPGLNVPDGRPETLHRNLIDHRDNMSVFTAKLAGFLDDPWGRDTVRSLRARAHEGARRTWR